MSLNFNSAPYFDDFDPTKNFHRILFKPGYAVQARELTQSQTILQNQISNFASSIFTQNTPISGGKITTNLNCYYIKLNFTYNGIAISAGNFLNKTIQDSTGTILARVIATAEGVTNGDYPTLIVNYLSGGQFTDASIITPTDGSNYIASVINSTTNNQSTGKSSTASISSGVFYVVNGYSQASTIDPTTGSPYTYSIGNFVQVNPQTIILDKYNNTPSLRVGLQISETIVNYIGDSSLLDPATGASNYQAPGADRYQVNLTLTSLPLSLGSDAEFIELFRISQGSITKQTDTTVYSTIDDYFANRDYETNGDYIVNDFKLTPSSYVGSNSFYNLTVGKGIAYVHGRRIENQSDITILNNRARTKDQVVGNDVYIDYGGYFYVDTINGLFDVTTLPSVDVHCVPAASINSSNVTTYNSTLVGSGINRNLVYTTDSGSSSSYVFKSYIADIVGSSLSGNATSSSTSTTIQFYDTSGVFSGVANAYFGATIALISGTSQGDTRKIVSYNPSTKTATVAPAFTKTPDSTTNFALLFDTTVAESVVQRTSNSVYTLKTTSNINTQFGKINGLTTGDTIYNKSTTPELLFNIGSPNVSSLANTAYFSTKTFRNKTFTNLGGSSSLTISMPTGSSLKFVASGTLSSSTIKNLFTVIDTSTGNIIDFTTGGATVVATPTTVTFTAAAAGGKTVNIIAYGISISNGDTTNYVLKGKNLVTGNTSLISTSGPDGNIGSNTYIDLTNAQVYIKSAAVSTSKLNLYVTDVKSISKIIDTKNPLVAPTSAMLSNPSYDVTNYFTLDNGQRDTHYAHAGITLVSGVNKPLGNILVIFNYYNHTGGDGYFSVNSYLGSSDGGVSTSPEQYAQIPTYKSSLGNFYNLTDTLDFRVSRKNAQVATSASYEFTGNPASDDTGALIPNDLSVFVSNYFYYLARKDKLVLTKDQNFQIIQGSPAINPILPIEPDGSLVLAELIHDAYTAYIPGENPTNVAPNLSINKVKHKRWTMKDITGLETRIENLEYYSSMNLLEQAAAKTQVPDVNGITRPNHGILVDAFSDYSVANFSDPNFKANINIRKNELKPLADVSNFQLQNPVVLNSLGTVSQINNYQINGINGNQTNIYTLPYTTKTIISQPLASDVLSVNPFSVINQQGVLQLNPPMDNWVDATKNPLILNNNPAYQIYQSANGVLNAINAGDFASIIGTPVSSQSSITQGGSNQSSATALGVNNGYITNGAVLPYIRPQQVITRSKGLLVNTPIKTWFDGQNVDQYIISPNPVELNGINGTFKENDVVGFYYNNKFYYLGIVVSLMNYPISNDQQITNAYIIYLGRTPDDTGFAYWQNLISSGQSSLDGVLYQIKSSAEAQNYAATGVATPVSGSTSASRSQAQNPVRLYVATIQGYSYAPAGTPLQNAQFDASGVYLGSTASGILTGTTVQSIHLSGTLSGVGGTYTANGVSGTPSIYSVKNPNQWTTFLNQYGVWGDLIYDTSGNSTNSYNANFVVNFPSNGTYTFVACSSGPATTSLNSSSIITTSSYSSVSISTQTMTAGNSNVSWSATNSSGPAGYALVIKDASGNIVFASNNPPVTYSNVTSKYAMSGGGNWYTGVKTIQMDPNASSSNNFYVGSQVKVTSTFVSATVTQVATYVPPPPAPTVSAVTYAVPYTVTDFTNDPNIWSNSPGVSPSAPPGAAVATLAGIVANIYQSPPLNRQPDSAGAAYWVQQACTNNWDTTTLAANISAAAYNNGDTRTQPLVSGNCAFIDKPSGSCTVYVSTP
jgi:hypothetical protein